MHPVHLQQSKVSSLFRAIEVAVTALVCFALAVGLASVTRYFLPHSRFQSPNRIHVKVATYGNNCRSFRSATRLTNRVETGNATRAVSMSCDGANTICPVAVDEVRLGDPAFGCAKDFMVTWTCGSNLSPQVIYVAPDASRQIVWIGCSATYKVR